MVRKDGKERDGAEKEEKRRRLKEKHKWNEENGGTRKEKKGGRPFNFATGSDFSFT